MRESSDPSILREPPDKASDDRREFIHYPEPQPVYDPVLQAMWKQALQQLDGLIDDEFPTSERMVAR